MKRRELLKLSAISAGLGALSGKVSSQSIKAFFKHGVASGDPTQDKVILWTRVTPNRPGNIKVTLEVATTKDFQNIVFQRDLYTNPTKDYTVKYDFKAGLHFKQGKSFYYRFHVNHIYSETGRSQTFPKE